MVFLDAVSTLCEYWKPIANGGKFIGNFGSHVHHTAKLIYILDCVLVENFHPLGQRECKSILP